jgi:hypothetical protein
MVALNISDDFDVKQWRENIAGIKQRLRQPNVVNFAFKPLIALSDISNDDVVKKCAEAFGCSYASIINGDGSKRTDAARLLAVRILMGLNRDKRSIVWATMCRKSDFNIAEAVFNKILPTGTYPVEDMIRFGVDGYGEINERPTMLEIIRLVSERMGVAPGSVIARPQKKKIKLARHISMALCRHLLNASFEKIAKEFGRRHHTTVISNINTVWHLVESCGLEDSDPAHIWADALARRVLREEAKA